MAGQRVNCPGCQQPLTVPFSSTIPPAPKRATNDITFDCFKCKQNIVIDEAGAGQLVDCPKCGTKLVVPDKPKLSKIAMTCKWCHKDITVDASLAGHLTHCPLCDDFIMPPEPATSSPSNQSASTAIIPATVNTPAPQPVPEPLPDKKCPFCAEMIHADAIKCKHCGEFLDGSPRGQATPSLPVVISKPPTTPETNAVRSILATASVVTPASPQTGGDWLAQMTLLEGLILLGVLAACFYGIFNGFKILAIVVFLNFLEGFWKKKTILGGLKKLLSFCICVGIPMVFLYGGLHIVAPNFAERYSTLLSISAGVIGGMLPDLFKEKNLEGVLKHVLSSAAILGLLVFVGVGLVIYVPYCIMYISEPVRAENYRHKLLGFIFQSDTRPITRENYIAELKANPSNRTAWDIRAQLAAERGDNAPKLALQEYLRGIDAAKKGSYEIALQAYKHAISLDGDSPWPFNNAAWLLATCPAKDFRDGIAAVGFAKEAVRISENDWFFLDTMATAYAFAGDFNNAIVTEELALKTCPNDWKAEFETRRSLFQKKQTWEGPDSGFPRGSRPQEATASDAKELTSKPPATSEQATEAKTKTNAQKKEWKLLCDKITVILSSVEYRSDFFTDCKNDRDYDEELKRLTVALESDATAVDTLIAELESKGFPSAVALQRLVNEFFHRKNMHNIIKSNCRVNHPAMLSDEKWKEVGQAAKALSDVSHKIGDLMVYGVPSETR